MHLMAKLPGFDTVIEPRPAALRAALEEARNRQAAASCLRAAATTEDAAERRSLRRRAAELIWPRRGRSEGSPHLT
jgi:hypothetical protein